jgi:hypothetical protein
VRLRRMLVLVGILVTSATVVAQSTQECFPYFALPSWMTTKRFWRLSEEVAFAEEGSAEQTRALDQLNRMPEVVEFMRRVKAEDKDAIRISQGRGITFSLAHLGDSDKRKRDFAMMALVEAVEGAVGTSSPACVAKAFPSLIAALKSVAKGKEYPQLADKALEALAAK